MTTKRDPIAASDAFDEKLKQYDLTPLGLYRYGRWNRRIGYIAIILAILLLGVGVVVNTSRTTSALHHSEKAQKLAQQARDQSVANAAATYTACVTANQFRVLDKQRWDYVIALSTPPQTAAGRQKLVEFMSFIAQVDQTRHCPPIQQLLSNPKLPALPDQSTPSTTHPRSSSTTRPRSTTSTTSHHSTTTSTAPTTTTTKPQPAPSTTTTTSPCTVHVPTDGCVRFNSTNREKAT